MITLELGDPQGLVDGVQKDGQKTLKKKTLKNRVRVIPETIRDIYWLASLAHQSERHAPAFGDGLLIKRKCLESVLNR